MRKARAAKIFEVGKEREDVFDARRDRTQTVRYPTGEDATNDLPERSRPSRLRPDVDVAVDAEVRHAGEKGCYRAEGGKAVAELDRQSADGRAVDLLQVCREITRKQEEVAQGF